MQGDRNVVGLERGQRGAQVGAPVRVDISDGVCQSIVSRRARALRLPELEVDHPLNANLGDVVVVEQSVGDTGDEDEKETRGGEQQGAEICPLGGFGGRRIDRDECCVLFTLGQERGVEGGEYLR